MKKVFMFLLPGLLGLSCKKTSPADVIIRIQNATALALDSVYMFYDNTHYNYGAISPNETTAYHSFRNMTDNAALHFISNDTARLSGSIFGPNDYGPHPSLPPGNYTLRIFPDSSFFSGYNTEFIQQ